MTADRPLLMHYRFLPTRTHPIIMWKLYSTCPYSLYSHNVTATHLICYSLKFGQLLKNGLTKTPTVQEMGEGYEKAIRCTVQTLSTMATLLEYQHWDTCNIRCCVTSRASKQWKIVQAILSYQQPQSVFSLWIWTCPDSWSRGLCTPNCGAQAAFLKQIHYSTTPQSSLPDISIHFSW